MLWIDDRRDSGGRKCPPCLSSWYWRRWFEWVRPEYAVEPPDRYDYARIYERRDGPYHRFSVGGDMVGLFVHRSIVIVMVVTVPL